MTTINVKMSHQDFAKWAKKLGASFMPAALRGVQAGAQRLIPELQKRTSEAPPASDNGGTGAVNTGLLKAGWRSEPKSDGATVFNVQPYSGVVEFGRRPGTGVGREGREALTLWATRRLGLSGNEAKAAAFAIARAISRRGLRARKILTGDPEGFRELVMKEIEREIGKALRGG